MQQPIQFETPDKEADRTVVFWSAVLEEKPWQVRTTIEERTEDFSIGTTCAPFPFSDVRVEIVRHESGTVLPVWAGAGFAADVELVRRFPAVHEAEENAIRIAEALLTYDAITAQIVACYIERFGETKEEA